MSDGLLLPIVLGLAGVYLIVGAISITMTVRTYLRQNRRKP